MLGSLWSCHQSLWLCYSWGIIISLSTNLQISFGPHWTIFFSIVTCMLLFTVTDAATPNISVSVCLYSSEALFTICKNPSHSNNTSILSILLELVLVSLCSLHYMCFICHPAVTLPSFVCEIFHYTSLARWAHWHFTECYDLSVIVQEYGQTLGLGLVDRNRTVVYY